MRPKTDGTLQTSLDYIRAIIVASMYDIDPDRISISNQKFKIPTDDGIFILIETKGAPKIISVRSAMEMVNGAYTEVQMVNTQEIVAVNIYSRNMDAIRRKEEILMALNSVYAQGIQEINGFSIARMARIERLNELEASAMLNRFEISIPVFSWFYKTTGQDYYDSFTAEVKTEDQTVEFTQNTE